MGDFDKKSFSVMPNLVVHYSPKYISGMVDAHGVDET